MDRRGRGPVLVYVPGIDGTGAMTLGLEERLAGFTLLRLRYVPDGPDTYPALADSVGRILAEEGTGEALLLAESFGGGVALELALRDPQRVRGLLLVNTFARYPHRLRLAAALALGPLVPGRVWGALRRRYGLPLLYGHNDPEVARRFHALREHFYDRAYLRRLRMAQHLDLRPRLPAVTQPSHVVAGDRDRVLDSVRAGRQLVAGLPRSVFTVVPGGGHLLLPRQDLPWPQWLAALREAS